MLQLAFLQDPEQLDLNLLGKIAHLVQEDRRAVGPFETPRLPRQGSRKGAFLAAEQLAFNEGARQGGTVDLDHGSVPARTAVVNGTGQQLLPRARFPQQQNGRVGGRHLPHLGEDPQHGRALPDDESVGVQGLSVLTEGDVFLLELIPELADLGQSLPELLLGPGSCQGIAQHLGGKPQARDQGVRPGSFLGDLVEGQRPNHPGALDRQREGHARFGARIAQARPVMGRLLRKLIHTGEDEGLSTEHLGERPGNQLQRAQSLRRQTARSGPAVGDLQGFLVLRELKEGATIQAENLRELLQAPLDGPVHLIRGQVEEAGGQVGKNRLEAQALFEQELEAIEVRTKGALALIPLLALQEPSAGTGHRHAGRRLKKASGFRACAMSLTAGCPAVSCSSRLHPQVSGHGKSPGFVNAGSRPGSSKAAHGQNRRGQPWSCAIAACQRAIQRERTTRKVELLKLVVDGPGTVGKSLLKRT